MWFQPTNIRHLKSQISIIGLVRAKLFKKLVDVEEKTKPFTVTLKYHEADALETYIRIWLVGQEDSYENTLASMVAYDLNQKLA